MLNYYPTIHGNEEAIEVCSDEFYQTVVDHLSESGELNAATARDRLGEIGTRLGEEGYTGDDINKGLLDAIQTAKDMQRMMDYL